MKIVDNVKKKTNKMAKQIKHITKTTKNEIDNRVANIIK